MSLLWRTGVYYWAEERGYPVRYRSKYNVLTGRRKVYLYYPSGNPNDPETPTPARST